MQETKLAYSALHHHKKAHGNFQPDWLNIFRDNEKKVKND